MVTVLVHPQFAIPYYAFYLEGLGRVFGHESIVFSREGGPEETEFNDGFAVTIRGGDQSHPRHRRLYLSTNDFARYDRVALDWCDRYGMVNHDPSVAAALVGREKIVPIGSSFGIRYWGGLGRTARDIVRILQTAGDAPGASFARLRGTRKLVTDRLPEHSYVPGRSRSDYVFFVGWPWKKHPEVNPPRARFMRACRSVGGLTFEGGFAPRRRNDVPDLEDVTADRIYPFRQWIRRTQASAVVFSCPAVHGCLGWKLGEFLALGKAIVSLPLTREMPAPLVDGEHILYVEDDQEAMREAVARIVGDDRIRTRLELGARRYYLEYLSPERVVQRLAFGS